MLRWKRANEQWMRDNPGQPLPDSMNVYQAEALSWGKIDKRLRDAERDLIDPLVKTIKDNGLTYEQIGEYAQAKHAQERNRELRRINPNIPDPAGMSDAEAQRILAAARPRQGNYDAAYGALRKLLDATLDMEVRDGLLSAQQAAVWRQRWADYVPMRHTEIGDRLGVGRGLEVRGKEHKQAFGRLSRADNPVEFAVHQLERAIIRGEHNKVGQTVGEFVRRTPEPDLWSATERPTIRYIDPRTGQVAEMVDPNYRSRQDVYTWKENGEQQSVWFKDPDYGGKLIRALKNMDQQRAGEIVRAMSWMTRQLARLNTSLNPEFMLSNFIRDAGEAFINLPTDQRRALSASFVKNLPMAIAGAARGQRPTGGGRFAQLFREFEQEGGRVGFYGASKVEEIGASIQQKLKRLEGGTINTLKDLKDRTLDAIDFGNNTIENATRLSVYVSARENGFTKPQAAFMAREATVNFNRRGESRALAAGYMFANAGLQGTVRGLQALKTSKRARKAAWAVAAMGGTLALYNIFAGGTDQDGRSKYSKIPAYQRQLNFIFMHPDGSGSYIKIPKPFFFGMFAGLADHLVSYLYDHGDAGKTMSGMAWDLISAVDPLGQDEGVAHFFPTVTKPVVQLYLNRGPFGTPIRPEEQRWSKFLSKAEGYHFRTTSGPAKAFAKVLNEMSGGDKKTPGYLDTSPENLDYLFGFVTGGLGRFAQNVYTSATRMYQGQEWAPEKTPFARRFYGEAPQPQANRALYYEEREKVQAAQQRKTPGPELGAADAFTATTKLSTELRKQREAIQANDKLSETEKEKRIKVLDDRELQAMLQARRALERNRARAEKRAPTF
jgi:tetratricopeptide (TPR) repeat protein